MRFIDGHHARFQRRDAFGIIIRADDLMAGLRETSSRHQPHISATDYRDSQFGPPTPLRQTSMLVSDQGLSNCQSADESSIPFARKRYGRRFSRHNLDSHAISSKTDPSQALLIGLFRLTVRKADPRHNRVHTANQEPVNS